MIYLVTNNSKYNTESKIYRLCNLDFVFTYFKDHKIIQLDTETQGFDPYTKELLTIQLGDFDNQFVIDYKTVDIQLLKPLLEKEGVIFILQNAKFDLRFFYHHRIIIKQVYDTFLVEKILTNGMLNIRRSLDHLVSRYCNTDIIDKDIRGQIHWRGLDETVIEYAANDVKYLEIIMHQQLAKAKELGMEKALSLDNRYVRVLAYTEYNGFKLDKEKWIKKCEIDDRNFSNCLNNLNNYIRSNNLNKYIDNQLDLFSSDTKYTLNWASSKQVIKLFKELGINTQIEEDGVLKDSVEASVLKPQADKFDIIPIYLEYKGAEKRLSTYGDTFIRQINPVSGRLHTQFTQLMDTSRLSSGGKDRSTGIDTINFQNIPSDKETRSCFISEEGNTLIVSDYSGQESVVFANKCMDEELLNFYFNGLGDLHSYVAKLCFKEELKDVSEADVKKVRPDLRQKAKGAGFALQYGGTGITIATNLNISLEEGNAVEKAYFEAFQGIAKYFKQCREFAIKNGYILFNDITGRRLFFDKDWLNREKRSLTPEFWDSYRYNKELNTDKYKLELAPKVKNYFRQVGAIERKAKNYPIQGSSADITKAAGIMFFDWLEKEGLLFKVLIPNFIHDEIVVESPKDIALKVSDVLRDCMEKAGDIFCKTIKLKAEPVLTDCWLK